MGFITGAVGAAIVAGIVSLIGLLISKESKISEFRQEWINGLREDVTSHVAYALSIHQAGDITNEHDPAFLELHKSTTRIALRLNPAETETHAVMQSMDELRQSIIQGKTFDDASKKVNEIIANTQVILKTEWNRVKHGELIYLWTLRVFVALIAISVIVIVGWYLHHLLWH